mmetsp:Transcript_159525/g.511869  ORF Transcript_159525/g.511869 Transcript_159525/m.511869 type:complete len:221 (-) Transcript_159525:480-1142(-)
MSHACTRVSNCDIMTPHRPPSLPDRSSWTSNCITPRCQEPSLGRSATSRDPEARGEANHRNPHRQNRPKQPATVPRGWWPSASPTRQTLATPPMPISTEPLRLLRQTSVTPSRQFPTAAPPVAVAASAQGPHGWHLAATWAYLSQLRCLQLRTRRGPGQGHRNRCHGQIQIRHRRRGRHPHWHLGSRHCKRRAAIVLPTVGHHDHRRRWEGPPRVCSLVT